MEDLVEDCSQFLSPSLQSPHSETLMLKINAYMNHGQLCDVILIAGSLRIPAHRVVLSAASDYFAAMFMSDLRESQEKEVELKDVDPEALKQLVDFMYSGRVSLREDTIESVLSAACLLQLDLVKDACCKFLVKQLHPSNCIGIRQFADAQGCDDLHRIAHNFVLDSFVDVMRNQEFAIMPVDGLARLLASDDLNVESEEIVYHAVLSWTKYDLPERKKHLPRLLALVRLPLLTPQFLAENVACHPLVQEDRECLRLVLDAMTYHAVPHQRASFPSSHAARPRKSTVGVLFAIGGMDSVKGATCIEKYELRTNMWSQVGHMNGRKLQFGVAVIAGKIYVVGGRDGLKTLNSVECFDPRERTWSLMPPMATHRHGLGVAVLEGPMYAVGGHDGWSYLNTVERWDPQSKQWSFVAQMSVARSTVGVAVLGDKLYAVGGRDGSSCLRSVECFDPHTNKWVLCSPMSRRRGGVGVTTCNGYLYAVGGHDAPASNPTSSRFDCVERYDASTDTWTLVSPISLPRDGVGVCTLGDKIFAVGGYDGQNYSKEVECFDPMLNEWTKVSSLNTGRAGACVVHYQPPAS